MNDEIYKEVPEEFSLQQVRPRFYFDLEMTAKELVQKFKDGIAGESMPCKGEANETYATLYFPKDTRHYWSPQLTLIIDETEEKNCHVRGLYGPRPAVWTMFVFFYALIGVAALFVLMIGGSEAMLGKSAPILWFLPVLIVVFLSLYYVAHLGKKKGKPEIAVMHEMLLKILEIVPNKG